MRSENLTHVGPPGANKGINLETVRCLVEAGCRVYLGARNPILGKAAADQVAAHFLEFGRDFRYPSIVDDLNAR